MSADRTRIRLDLTDIPLHNVLEQIATQAGFVLKRRGPLEDPVTLRLDNAPLIRALSILLGDRSHVMHFAPGVPGEPRRLAWVYVRDSGGGQSVTFRPPSMNEPERALGAGQLHEEREALRHVARTVRLQPKDAIAELRVQLQLAESVQVREAAVRALGRIGTPDALRALDAALRDRQPMVRSAALRELGAARGGHAAQQLADVLQHSAQPAMRVQAARHLGNHPGAPTRRALQAALDDPDPTVRSVAEQSLAFLSRRRG